MSLEYPSTSSPGVIKSDAPTPRGSEYTIRIRLPCYFVAVPADVLVLSICIRRDGHVDCYSDQVNKGEYERVICHLRLQIG